MKKMLLGPAILPFAILLFYLIVDSASEKNRSDAPSRVDSEVGGPVQKLRPCKQPTTGETGRDHMAGLHEWYIRDLHGRFQDVIWLRGDESPAESQRLIREHADHVQRLLQRYQDTTDLTRRVAQHFSSFKTCKSNSAQMLSEINSGTVAQSRSRLCVIPESDWNPGVFSSQFIYSTLNKTVYLRAIESPDIYYAGMIFHELGHGLRHEVDGLPPVINPKSDAAVAEEVGSLPQKISSLMTRCLVWSVLGRRSPKV